MIKILGFLNSVCQRFLKAALVRTRADVTEALRTVSMMLNVTGERLQREMMRRMSCDPWDRRHHICTPYTTLAVGACTVSHMIPLLRLTRLAVSVWRMRAPRLTPETKFCSNCLSICRAGCIHADETLHRHGRRRGKVVKSPISQLLPRRTSRKLPYPAVIEGSSPHLTLARRQVLVRNFASLVEMLGLLGRLRCSGKQSRVRRCLHQPLRALHPQL